MDYILNELSLNQVDTKYEARSLLENFVKTCIKAKNDLFLDTLRIDESVGSLFHILVTKDYPISKWVKDIEVDYDLRQKFYQIVSQSPLLKKEEKNELDIFSLSVFKHDGIEAEGLGVAYLLETLAVSLIDIGVWNNNILSISHDYFDEDENIISENRNVVHSSKDQHVATHIEYFNDLRSSLLSKCSDIWLNKGELFPNLIFCGKTKKQLLNGISSKYVFQIFDRLKALNEYTNSWKTGDFSIVDFKRNYNVDCSGETDCTLNIYGDQRRFSIQGIGSRIFDLHIKTGNLRFHFFPESSTKKVYIGYIGPHLDTCKG